VALPSSPSVSCSDNSASASACAKPSSLYVVAMDSLSLAFPLIHESHEEDLRKQLRDKIVAPSYWDASLGSNSWS
jgi:hypothetical protein